MPLKIVRNDRTKIECDAIVNAAKSTSKNAPTVIIKLKGNYSGTIYKYFTINKINLNTIEHSIMANTL